MGKKRGRPKKENVKNKRLNIRLSEDEYERLESVMSRTGESATKIMLEGLRMYYNLTKYKH